MALPGGSELPAAAYPAGSIILVQPLLGMYGKLYAEHKVLTYPRTDSRALPDDYLPTIQEILDTTITDPGAIHSP